MLAARSAGCAFSVRLRSSSGPSHASRVIGSPSASSAAANTAAASGEDLARARPMPTDWLPCPGNTKAIWLIARQRRRDRRLAARQLRACLQESLDRTYARRREDPPVTDTERPAQPTPTPRARRPRPSDPAAGPALPEAMTRTRRRKAAPSRVIARVFEADLSAPVVAAGTRIQNVRQISERVAMGRPCGASWSSASPISSASSTSGSRSSPPCTSSPKAPRRRSPTSPRRSGARRPPRHGSSTGWSSGGSSSGGARRTTGGCAPCGSRRAARPCSGWSTGPARSSSCPPSGRCRAASER